MDTKLPHTGRVPRCRNVDWMQMVIKFVCELTQQHKLQLRFTENDILGFGSFVNFYLCNIAIIPILLNLKIRLINLFNGNSAAYIARNDYMHFAGLFILCLWICTCYQVMAIKQFQFLELLKKNIKQYNLSCWKCGNCSWNKISV